MSNAPRKYMKLTAAIVPFGEASLSSSRRLTLCFALVVAVVATGTVPAGDCPKANPPAENRDSPKQHEIAALGQSLFSMLAPGSRFVTGGITKFEEDLRYNEASREDLEFLRSLGIRQGSSIINIGGLGDANLALAAAYLGATYIEYDLKKRNVDKFMRDMGVDSMEGSAKIIQGEFSSWQNSASKDIPDRSQDVVVMLTGALSDPRPESDPEKVLRETLRVIKGRGKIVIGSYDGWWVDGGDCLSETFSEKLRANRLIEELLGKPEYKGRVRLIRGQEVKHEFMIGDIYEVEFIMSDKPAPSQLEAMTDLRRAS